LESDPTGYLTKLQYRETQLKGVVAKLPQRAKKGSEIAEKVRYESELEEIQKAVHKLKHSLK
jgi:predicted CopG family antitoxin